MIDLNKKIDELLESQARDKELHDKDLRAIFREYYDGFNKLRINTSVFSRSNKNQNITLVQEGSLSHNDSMGNGSTIYANDVQVMSAGTGIEHSDLSLLLQCCATGAEFCNN